MTEVHLFIPYFYYRIVIQSIYYKLALLIQHNINTSYTENINLYKIATR